MRRGLPGFGADRTECLPLVPDPCQGKPGSQMDICFMDRKDIQFPCHCHQCQEIIIFIHSLIRDKFFVPFADTVIGSVVFKNVSGKDWLCFISGDSGRCDCIGSFRQACVGTSSDVLELMLPYP